MDIKDFFNLMAEDWDKRVVHNAGKIKHILSLFEIKKDSKVLDAGCGTGILENFLNGYNITAADISDKMIEKSKSKFKNSGINFLCSDLFDIDSKFDFIILYSVYPHIFNKERLAEKLYELLNTSGRFLIFHSESKEAINGMHNIKALEISVKIKSVNEEKTHFEKFFKIDKTIDDDNYFLISGTREK